jgi:RimJ/RimL family protein N-acetyltransferase
VDLLDGPSTDYPEGMKPLEPVHLRGRFVSLEPLAVGHAAELSRAANEARGTYAFTLVPPDVGGMAAYVAHALGEWELGQALPFSVRDAAGALVGSTRFLSIERWTSDLPHPEAVEIGFTWYAERVQRTALNTEAKLLLCTHAFETWNVRRISWKTDARNKRSRAAILRLGAAFDGVLRAHRLAVDGTVRDTAFFSMLASEWPSHKEKLVRRLAIGEAETGSVVVAGGTFEAVRCP